MLKSSFKLLFLLWATALFAGNSYQENKPHTVRVLLQKLADQAIIEIQGPYQLEGIKKENLIDIGTHKKKLTLQAIDQGFIYGDRSIPLTEIRIVPLESRTRIVVNGIPYRGCMEFFSIGGTINTVNEIDVENFLKKTLPMKIDEKYSKETLEAICIVERTELIHTIQKGCYASWQVEAEKVGYVGTLTKTPSPLTEAIERTRDMILYHKKQPFYAKWSPNLAGTSVSYLSVFRKQDSSPRGVQQLPSEVQREKSKWKTAVSVLKLAEFAQLSSISEIDLFRAEKSGKVYAVRIKGPEGKKDVDFFTLQKVLGANALQSNDFKVIKRGNKFHFFGYGKGAGVGLCALSAQIMSKRGESAQNILYHHFPEAQLINLREELGLHHQVNPIWR